MGSVYLNERMLNRGKSVRNGWNKKQIELFGVNMSVRGWKKKILNKWYPQEVYDDFLKLKNYHFKKKDIDISKLKSYKTIIKNPKQTKNKFKKTSKKRQYNDDRWLAVRDEILKRDEYTCKSCGRENCVFHVHHIKYVGEFVWDTPNKYLVTLCDLCHKETHKK